ncbi:MAG: transglutaminase-like domain-containing protein [Thermofilaceae archaeon]
MEQDGFYLATRIVNPILLKYRSFLVEKYGADVLDLKPWYLHYYDVNLYVQIEKLRDALALNEINKEEFAEKVLTLTRQQRVLSPAVLQIISELYETLTGQSTSFLQQPEETVEHKPELKPIVVQENVPTMSEGLRGKCPRCNIEGDRSEKALFKCEYCGELYCEKHVAPRLVMTFSQYQAYLEHYHDIASILRKHWTSKNGHPCTMYTSWFWKNYYESDKQLELMEAKEKCKKEKISNQNIEFMVCIGHKEKKDIRKIITISFLFILLCGLFTLAFLTLDFDADELPNWLEINKGLDFLKYDTDDDGLSDAEELKLGTNPLVNDTDNDGLPDGSELRIGTKKIGTNPLVNDTDNDGLLDGFELRIGTNPLLYDTDDDGLSDAEELKLGTNPLVNDTDNDGLPDVYELKIGTNPKRNWRKYFDNDTIKSALSKFFRAEISHIASRLKGGSLEETVWNVLKWIYENIKYDYEKANKTDTYVYSPSETVKFSNGICTDYSLLTAALLLEAGVNEVYILELYPSIPIICGSSGHATVAVVINGRTYVLDQVLPPLRYEEYLHYLSEQRNGVTLLCRWYISLVYKVSLDSLGEPEVQITESTLLPKWGNVSSAEIGYAVYRALRRLNPVLQWDTALESTAKMALMFPSLAYLPYGYKEGIFYKFKLHPATLGLDFAEVWFSEVFKNSEIQYVINRYSRIYVYVDQTYLFEKTNLLENRIVILIVLANP